MGAKKSMATADQRVVAAFPDLMVAGEADELLGEALEVTMNDDWMGYLSFAVLAAMNKLHTGRLAFLLLVPDPVAAEVIMVPTDSQNAYGATPVKYVDTETGAWVNLRLALKRLNVERQPRRVRVFPITERTGADGKTYFALSVKESSTRPVKKVERKSGAKSGKETSSTKPGATEEATPEVAPAAENEKQGIDAQTQSAVSKS